MSKTEFKFPGYSALFHAVKGLIFLRGGLALKVKKLRSNPIVKSDNYIGHFDRIKTRLFNSIQYLYNRRIKNYSLKLDEVVNMDNLVLQRFSFTESRRDDRFPQVFSGDAEVFPKTFVCKKCGDFVISYNLKNLSKKCQNKGCNAEYEQVTLVKFCEECGTVDQLFYQCQNNKSHRVTLLRGQQDDLLTWYFQCSTCRGKLVDIFQFNCYHQEFKTKLQLSDKPQIRFKPLTVRAGGVFVPVVVTMIDLPPSNHIGDDKIDYVGLAISKGLIKDPKDASKKLSFSEVNSAYELYRNEFARKATCEDCSDEKWREVTKVVAIEQAIDKLKETISSADVADIIEYLTLTGLLSKQSNIVDFSAYSSTLKNEEEKLIVLNAYENIKKRLRIKTVQYIEQVRLVSANIGLINGVNRFYDDDYVPHFEPIWENISERKKFESYLHSYDTEGLIISLDETSILNWLKEIGVKQFTQLELKDASMTFMKLSQDIIDDYVFPLLHTMSHHLIKLSSVYTGLDSDSCSEMIFPKSASIFLFSTSTINIGGFRYLFENSLFRWFDKLEEEMSSCIYDPMCNNNNGACFSCSFLPEYVCSDFNKNLDRDIFLGRRTKDGKKDYLKGFWKND